jgi:hypothetical protein
MRWVLGSDFCYCCLLLYLFAGAASQIYSEQRKQAKLECFGIATRDGSTYWPNKHVNDTSVHPPTAFHHANLSHFSTSSVWKLELCMLRSASAHDSCQNCTGSIRISRLVGCDPTLPADMQDFHDQDVRAGAELLGPDEIFVLLEGPEFMSPQQLHSGNCVYSFNFVITIPGTYRLSATVIRSDWNGFWSGSDVSFPPQTLDVLTIDKQLLAFGNASRTLDSFTFVTSEHHNLAPCLTSSDRSGRWIQVPLQVGMFERTPAVYRRMEKGFDQSFFTELAGLEWFPYSCHWKKFSSAEASKCLSGKNILVHGDSQTRTLYNHVAISVCGVDHAAVKGFLDVKCYNKSTSESASPCPGIQSCFQPDVLGTSNITEAANSDVFWVNFGQHPLSYGVSLSSYKQHVSAYFQRIGHFLSTSDRASASSRPRVIWFETQPYPIATHSGAFLARCKRTQQRTQLANAVAAGAFAYHINPQLSKQVFFIETFEMLSAVIEASPDNAHLTGYFPAMDAMTNMLLAAMGC